MNMPVDGMVAPLVTALGHPLERTAWCLFGVMFVLLALMNAHSIILSLVPSLRPLGTLLLRTFMVLAFRTTGARLVVRFIFRND